MMVYADEDEADLMEELLHQIQLVKRYRRMLFEMTSLIDWLNEGYPMSEYQALCDEFDKPASE